MKMKSKARARRAAPIAALLACLTAALFAGAQTPVGSDGSILGGLKHNSVLGTTVPGNGDVNPYGMAQVKYSVGKLTAGHILISNFNNSTNAQGTGTTIVDMAPNGSQALFAALHAATLPGPCPGGLGLTTALVVLNEGWVIVGSLPTTNGKSPTAKAGCLIVLDSMGNPVETIYGSLINGPWDMTALERARRGGSLRHECAERHRGREGPGSAGGHRGPRGSGACLQSAASDPIADGRRFRILRAHRSCGARDRSDRRCAQ